MRKVLFINPVGTDLFDREMKEMLQKESEDGTEVEVRSLSKGPHHLEYYSYEAVVLADMLDCIRRAEKEKFDAAVIGCFYDPGLREAREISNMVITAPAESSIHLASMLGYKFSVIVGRRKWIPQMEENVVKYGLKDKLASFKSVDLGVLEFHEDEKETEKRLKQAGKEAIERDEAEVIILGCTVQFGFFRELEEYLGVPVIDAVIAPFKYAEFLVDLKRRYGWCCSRIGEYQPPLQKEIREWNLR